MSKGLGWVQRAILKILEEREQGSSLRELAELVYPGQVTRSHYVATQRAVDSLERRGRVRTWELHFDGRTSIDSRGGRTRMKVVQLNVDPNGH